MLLSPVITIIMIVCLGVHAHKLFEESMGGSQGTTFRSRFSPFIIFRHLFFGERLMCHSKSLQSEADLQPCVPASEHPSTMWDRELNSGLQVGGTLRATFTASVTSILCEWVHYGPDAGLKDLQRTSE